MREWAQQWVIFLGAITVAIPILAAGIVKIILALQGVSEKVDKLEVKVDGRLSQLLERTASASRAQGVEAGRGEMIVPATTATPAVIEEEHLVVGIPTPMPPVLLVPVEAPEEKKKEP